MIKDQDPQENDKMNRFVLNYNLCTKIIIKSCQLGMDVNALIESITNCKLLPELTIKKICRKVQSLLFQQSNVQPVQAPVTLCGDVHGQFFDVLQMFQKGGNLPNESYIMIGDFVDRGYHSVETITLLFLLKLKYPDKIILLRGNHQSRTISMYYGFYDQISKKYGNHNVWYYFTEVFDYLPIAAIIEGSLFCVHGGLSPRITTIDHIRSIQRNVQVPNSGPLCDFMWSDPEEIDTWKQNSRGAGWLFGKKPVDEFLHKNQVKKIVRAHQLVNEGYRKQFDDQLYTVWSAPNYCYRMNNLGAILKIDGNLGEKFIVYEASVRSKKSENYKNLLPYFL